MAWLLGVALLAGGMVLAEGLFRCAMRRRGRAFVPAEKIPLANSHYAPHPYLPAALVPGAVAPGCRISYRWHEQPVVCREQRINRHGYCFDEQLLAARDLVVVLGNCTFGADYWDGETHHQLHEFINRAVDGKYTFVPVAQGGWTSMDMIYHLYTRIAGFKPRAVVLNLGLNDLLAALAPGFRADYSHFIRNLGEADWKRRLRDVLPKIRAWHLYEYVIGNYLGTGNVRCDLLPMTRKAKLDFAADYGNLHVEESIVRSMVGICRAQNIRPVLTTYLYYLDDELAAKPTYRKLREGVAMENEMLRRVARDSQVPLIDMAAEFPFAKKYFYDETHLSPAGMEAYSGIFRRNFMTVMADR